MRRRPWALGILLLGGCLHPVGERTDRAVFDLAARPLDAAAPAWVDRGSPPSFDTSPSAVEHREKLADDAKLPAPRLLRQRLHVPPELPGAGAARTMLPPTTAPAAEREAAIAKLFPSLPPLGADPRPCPETPPLTLADLQRLAISQSPLIRQAAADVEAARGAFLQAGAYPNPVTGWAQDEVGTAISGPAELGVFIGQTFVLGGKLTLARAMAQVDLDNAELALKKARADLAGQVRAGYFAVLVAQENLKASRAMAKFTDEIFLVQVDQVKHAQAAAYEPRQLRVFALQARNNLVAARNRYTSAWKQLAATLGAVGMAPAPLAGDVAMPIPRYPYDAALTRVLKEHTDVATARNAERKARYALQKSQVAPIPDVTLNMHVNKYFTENNYVHSLDIQFPLPIFDRNKGGIIQAQGNLVHAVEEAHRVRDDLTARLADAFERYDTNRAILEEYRDGILTDQVEAYLGAVERHQQEPDKVGFGDVVAAQQALATTITGYVSTLGTLWQAVADVSTLLQTEDVFQAVETEQWPAVPDLEQLPCCHPCVAGSEANIQGADGHWPAAAIRR